MAEVNVTGSFLGTELYTLLMSDTMVPGDNASYELCKCIYLYHPLGKKMVASPLNMAQSQKRDINVQDSPGEQVVKAFLDEWVKIGADKHIFHVSEIARTYGMGSIVMGSKDVPPDKVLSTFELQGKELFFNVLDPLNTAGSVMLNQDPNSSDFQRSSSVEVQGKAYHPSRALVMLNEDPVYISYSASAYGYVGRSVYQRALFPLKSFIQSMVTDDMVTRKAGVLIIKAKPTGSIIDRTMATIQGIKRNILREAKTDNVISIGLEETVESLDLHNVQEAPAAARKNILENIAVSADMPAKIINQETFAEGFGEGTEDAKQVARYVDRIRIWMDPAYQWFSEIVMFRAWTPEFYQTIQAMYPEWCGDMDYKTAFYRWKNSFTPSWPSLLTEPDSEKIKVEETKLKSVNEALKILLPELDPANKAKLLMWAQDCFNENQMLFPSPMQLDMDEYADFAAQKAQDDADNAKKTAENGGKPPGPPGAPGQEEPEEDGPDSPEDGDS